MTVLELQHRLTALDPDASIVLRVVTDGGVIQAQLGDVMDHESEVVCSSCVAKKYVSVVELRGSA